MGEIELFVVEDGFNPRENWELDISEELEESDTVSVEFDPFNGLYPIYCQCYDINDGYALLKVPPKEDGDSPTDWFPPEDWSWCIVPEIFLRPQ